MASSNFSTTNNQLTISSPSTTYDSAGNQKSLGGYTFTFDAEERMVSSALNNTTTYYAYDGEGQRVKKTQGANQTVYVYDAAGNLAAEYPSTPAVPPCVTCYVTVDHLGSTRVVSDSSGNVVARYDYLPFGEEIPADSVRTTTLGYKLGSDGFNPKFTGQVRDTETGFDFFNARYYSGAQGRFVASVQIRETVGQTTFSLRFAKL